MFAFIITTPLSYRHLILPWVLNLFYSKPAWFSNFSLKSGHSALPSMLPSGSSDITSLSWSLAPPVPLLPCTLLHQSQPDFSHGAFTKEAPSLLLLLCAQGPAHQHRSWLCRPSSRRHRHSGYTPPRSRLHLHTFHPPGHTLLGPEVRGNS